MKSEVLIFDVEAFGMNLFRWGLYSVLRNGDRLKVVHHCFISLENVLDMVAAHLVPGGGHLDVGEESDKETDHLEMCVRNILVLS